MTDFPPNLNDLTKQVLKWPYKAGPQVALQNRYQSGLTKQLLEWPYKVGTEVALQSKLDCMCPYKAGTGVVVQSKYSLCWLMSILMLIRDM